MLEAYRELAIAIVERAVDDYRNLIKQGKEAIHNDDMIYGKAEIKSFLLSDYCDRLLEEISFTGSDILKHLDKEVVELV